MGMKTIAIASSGEENLIPFLKLRTKFERIRIVGKETSIVVIWKKALMEGFMLVKNMWCAQTSIESRINKRMACLDDFSRFKGSPVWAMITSLTIPKAGRRRT